MMPGMIGMVMPAFRARGIVLRLEDHGNAIVGRGGSSSVDGINRVFRRTEVNSPKGGLVAVVQQGQEETPL